MSFDFFDAALMMEPQTPVAVIEPEGEFLGFPPQTPSGTALFTAEVGDDTSFDWLAVVEPSIKPGLHFDLGPEFSSGLEDSEVAGDGDGDGLPDPEIFVIGPSRSDYAISTPDAPWGDDSASIVPGEVGVEPPLEPDCSLREMDDSSLTSAESEAAKEIKAKVAAMVDAVLGKMAGTAGDTNISFGSNDFSIREAYSLLSKMDFKLYSENHDFGASNISSEYPAGGTANRNDGDPVFSVRTSTLSNFSAFPGGLEFYVLHELVHVTREFWDAIPGAGASAAERLAFEGQVDAAVFALAKVLGIDLKGFVPRTGTPPQGAVATQGSGEPAGAKPVCGG